MESKMTTSQLVIKNKNYDEVNHVAVVAGSSKRFRGVPELGDYITQRPLMVDAWSQTNGSDFSFFKLLELNYVQTQREKELEEKVRELQDNLGKFKELLDEIRATSMKISALFEQQHWENQFTDNTGSNDNNGQSFSNSRGTQLSPRIINSNHQSTSPAESLIYKIIAESKRQQNYESINYQMANKNRSLNLNSPADSPEGNIEKTTECNTDNNTMRTAHRPVGVSPNSTLIKHHMINKRTLAAEQQELPIANTHNECNTTIESISHIRLKLPSRKSTILTAYKLSPKMQSTPNKNIHPSTAYQNLPESAGSATIGADNVMVQIGPNNTYISKLVYDNINWSSPSAATRKLLMNTFGRHVLATHSMTGRPSPAFMDRQKPAKQMLDPAIVSDIIFAVTRKCNVSEKEVRMSITTKCADENKMMRLQMNKRAPMNENNKENLSG